MIVVSPETVWNPGVLETRAVPKRIFGRVMILPRRAGWAEVVRLLFEVQVLRFTAALLPFVVAMFVWPHLALPIAQAPVAMVIAIGFVELKVFRMTDAARARIMGEDEAARVLDLLRFRATAILRKIAAGRDMDAGELTLVVEQSELARVWPLTLVSLQRGLPDPEVLSLGAHERELLDGLFDADLTERDLQKANLLESETVRVVGFDARSVSAHARLAARLRAKAAPA